MQRLIITHTHTHTHTHTYTHTHTHTHTHKQNPYQLAFRPGVVDLPAGGTTAPINAITMTEMFQDFSVDADIPPVDLVYVLKGGERERERERDRHTDRQTDRQTERQRDRETETDGDRDRQRQRQTERNRETQRETEIQRDRQTETDMQRDAERDLEKSHSHPLNSNLVESAPMVHVSRVEDITLRDDAMHRLEADTGLSLHDQSAAADGSVPFFLADTDTCTIFLFGANSVLFFYCSCGI